MDTLNRFKLKREQKLALNNQLSPDLTSLPCKRLDPHSNNLVLDSSFVNVNDYQNDSPNLTAWPVGDRACMEPGHGEMAMDGGVTGVSLWLSHASLCRKSTGFTVYFIPRIPVARLDCSCSSEGD